MRFSLIICTYKRPKAIITLLKSVEKQLLYPNEIIIVDGSEDDATQKTFTENIFKNLSYFKVSKENRGLTKQRNYGISKVSNSIDIVCFLDDDIVLTENYFQQLLSTYKTHPNAGGVGGYIANEVSWRVLKNNEKATYTEYEIDGYARPLGVRNVVRKFFGLLSDKPPCIMPEFSNGLSIGSLPPNNKIYKVDHFMGGVSSFKKEVVSSIKFSTYFEGYGLYEDSDYCLRVSKKYQLYVNTGATLFHYHDGAGRPNKFTYGKMVVRNGWYVWRVGYLKPSLKARFKWHLIALLLISIRVSNSITSSKRKEAFTESLGRFVGWLSVILNPPKNNKH